MELLTFSEVSAIIATCSLIAFDVVTGVLVGLLVNGLSSVKSRKGVAHKTGLLLAIVFGVILHIVQQFFDLGIHIPVLMAICLYIALTECISIVENIGELSPQLKNTKFMKLFAFAYDGKESFGEEAEDES